MSALLRVFTTIEGPDGVPIEGTSVEAVRFASPFSVLLVTDDGPTRIEIGGDSSIGVLLAVNVEAPLTMTGPATSPVIHLPAAVASGTAGSLSGADKAKLDSIANGAAIAAVNVTAPLTVSGTTTRTIAIPDASHATAGSQSTDHFDLLNGATPNADAGRLAYRTTNGDCAFGTLTAAGLIVGDAGTSFASAIGLVPATDAYAATVPLSCKAGGHHEITLTGNVSFLAPTNLTASPALEVFVTQGGGGGNSAAWASSGAGQFIFPTPLTGTLIGTLVNEVDYFRFKHRASPSSHWVCTAHYKYTTP